MSGKGMIERYLEMDYPVLVARDLDSRQCVVEIPDWPGCRAHGATIEEAFRKLDDAKYVWVEDCLERGITIPPARPAEDYSGKFLLRIARSLHRRLAMLANGEGVSLNTYVSTVLAEHVGVARGESALKLLRDEITATLGQLSQHAANRNALIATETLKYLVHKAYMSTEAEQPSRIPRTPRNLFRIGEGWGSMRFLDTTGLK
jgi:antitoxin HicB